MAKLGITIQHMDRYSNTTNTYTSAVLTQTTQFRAVVQSGSCAPANSTTTTVTVDQGSVGGSVSGGTTICSGSTSGLLTLSGQTGAVLRWQARYHHSAHGQIFSNTTNTYTSAVLTQTTQFRAVVQSGSCAPANSTTTTVTITANNTIILSSAAGTDAQMKCINTTITNITYATTGATGAIVTGLPSGVTVHGQRVLSLSAVHRQLQECFPTRLH